MAPHAQSLNSCLHAWPQNFKAFQTKRNGWKKNTKMWSVLLSNIWFLWFLQSMFLLSYLYQWCIFCWQSLCRNLWPQFVLLQFSYIEKLTEYWGQCSHNTLATLVPSVLVYYCWWKPWKFLSPFISPVHESHVSWISWYDIILVQENS